MAGFNATVSAAKTIVMASSLAFNFYQISKAGVSYLRVATQKSVKFALVDF